MIEGLYIHIPFCQKRCFYCDFNTYEGLENIVPDYHKALLKDMELGAGNARCSGLKSVFFGGGTPSLLDADLIGELLSKAKSLFGFRNDIEVTLEANPGTASLEKFQDYLNA